MSGANLPVGERQTVDSGGIAEDGRAGDAFRADHPTGPAARLAALVDCCIRVPSDDIGQHEDAHLVVNHVLTCGIRARLSAE